MEKDNGEKNILNKLPISVSNLYKNILILLLIFMIKKIKKLILT